MIPPRRLGYITSVRNNGFAVVKQPFQRKSFITLMYFYYSNYPHCPYVFTKL
jgi:hypothetical protein